jgi:hypothetical protein
VQAGPVGFSFLPDQKTRNKTMVDDRKHSEAVKCWFTERELVDLSRLAAREDRKLSELVRVIVRRHLYGHIGCDAEDFHRANGSDQGRNA